MLACHPLQVDLQPEQDYWLNITFYDLEDDTNHDCAEPDPLAPDDEVRCAWTMSNSL